jgi:nucleoside-diphosphate-sugar epimerase
MKHQKGAFMNNTRKLLIIGGSGFLSGTLARQALQKNYQVWAVTRGKRSLPPGVKGVTVDRHDANAFRDVITSLDVHWDLVVDCIAYEQADILQDVDVLPDRCGHLVFISTDFVYDPARRIFPQGEESEAFTSDGYGGKKRKAELALESADTGNMGWTILRPCHIYGPGSQLGCMPEHGRDPRLINRLQAGETLRLVGGGHFLQQPILARDLSETILSVAGNSAANRQIFCAAGPKFVESREYYRIIAEQLRVGLNIEELSVQKYLLEHPDSAPFLCHRIYDLSKLRAAGCAVPNTPLEVGLRDQVISITAMLT